MNLVEYGRILLRRGWIMILLAVVAAVAAFFVSQQMTPIYRATQVILMVPSRSDFGLTQAAIGLLNQRATYLRSDIVATQIIDDLQQDMSPGFLRSRTTIAPNRDNLTIQIDVDLQNPAVAEAFASAWGAELIRYQEELNQEALREDRIRAQRQDNAYSYLLRPNVRINTIVGAVVGLFLGAVIVFVLEFLESNMIRRREDLERMDGLKVLATIPD